MQRPVQPRRGDARRQYDQRQFCRVCRRTRRRPTASRTLTGCTLSGNIAQQDGGGLVQRWHGDARQLHDQRQFRSTRRRSAQTSVATLSPTARSAATPLRLAAVCTTTRDGHVDRYIVAGNSGGAGNPGDIGGRASSRRHRLEQPDRHRRLGRHCGRHQWQHRRR